MTTLASTTRRGYGAAHQRVRRQVALVVAAGEAVCWRCGKGISPFAAWDLGHDDADRSRYRGPEHRKCNRRAAGQKAALLKRARRRVSRQW